MPFEKRTIDDVLKFRSDISPFLVHLTRKKKDGDSAKEVLKSIFALMELKCANEISDARFGMLTNNLKDDKRLRLFGAVSFTETPISEIHCLLEIDKRTVDLEPYGFVFIKDRLRTKGVSPVLYLNNISGDKQQVLQDLCTLASTHTKSAEELLPLISIFGKRLTPPGADSKSGSVDFLWEREWRYPHSKGGFKFDLDDIFIGLCPHDEIEYFEDMMRGIDFVDPRRNMKWYAKKLIEARQKHDLKFSVI